jgi:hypothetical protein
MEFRNRGSSVSIVSDYGMNDRTIGVRSPTGANNFSSILRVQTGSEAHSAFCTMGTGEPYPGANRCWVVTLTTHPLLVPKSRMSRSYTSSPPKSAPLRVARLLCFVWNFNLPPAYSISGRSILPPAQNFT